MTSGSLACIRSLDPIYGERFFFLRVREAKNGRIATARGVFWAVNGEKCDPGWGGDAHQLVVPTLALPPDDRAEPGADGAVRRRPAVRRSPSRGPCWRAGSPRCPRCRCRRSRR
ncbi:hypothetical protein ACU4GA_13870 [Methylobacterium oryzae CBMB20]